MKEILNDLGVLWRDIYRPVVGLFQRIFRGYSNTDLWGLDYYIAKRILPALKAFRKAKKYGYPNDFKTFKDWQKAIDDMIFGLEEIIKEECTIRKFNKKRFDRAVKGRELFGKYLTALWD